MKLPLNLLVKNVDEIWEALPDDAARLAWTKEILGFAAAHCGTETVEFDLKSKRLKVSKAPDVVVEGLTIKEIAAKYGLHEASVKFHKKSLEFTGTRALGTRGSPCHLYSLVSVEKLAAERRWETRLVDDQQSKRLQEKLESQNT